MGWCARVPASVPEGRIVWAAVSHSAKMRLSSKPWTWMGQCRNQAGPVLFLVLPVASWVTLSKSLRVSATLIPLLCNGGLLSRSTCKKTGLVIVVVVVFHFLTCIGKLLFQTRDRHTNRSLSFPHCLPKCLPVTCNTKNMPYLCLLQALQSSLSSFSAASSAQDVLWHCLVLTLSLNFPLLSSKPIISCPVQHGL